MQPTFRLSTLATAGAVILSGLVVNALVVPGEFSVATVLVAALLLVVAARPLPAFGKVFFHAVSAIGLTGVIVTELMFTEFGGFWDDRSAPVLTVLVAASLLMVATRPLPTFGKVFLGVVAAFSVAGVLVRDLFGAEFVIVKVLVAAPLLLVATHLCAYRFRRQIDAGVVAAVDYIVLLAAVVGVFAILDVDVELLRIQAKSLEMYSYNLAKAKDQFDELRPLYCSGASLEVPPEVGTRETFCSWLRQATDLSEATAQRRYASGKYDVVGWEPFVAETLKVLQIPDQPMVDTSHLPKPINHAANAIFEYFGTQGMRVELEERATRLKALREKNALGLAFGASWLLAASLILGLTRVTIGWRGWKV